MRIAIVTNALDSPFKFSSSTSAKRDQRYWTDDKDPDAPYHVRNGVSASLAIREMWSADQPIRTGCVKAAELILLKAIADTIAKSTIATSRFDNTIGIEPPSQLLGESSTPFQDVRESTTPQGFTTLDLKPGDRVWFENPFWKKGDPIGEEGSNPVLFIAPWRGLADSRTAISLPDRRVGPLTPDRSAAVFAFRRPRDRAAS